MNESGTALATSVTRAYVAQRDPPFGAVLRQANVGGDDDALADLIELDARTRLDSGLSVEIGRYLEAVPDLSRRRVALDASIEFSLRAARRSGMGEEEAAREMVRARPELAEAVALAVMLDGGVCSTMSLKRVFSDGEAVRLPRDLGPALADGRARYELRQVLGSGAQGWVYAAVDRAMSEPDRPAFVAVKVLRNVSDDPAWRALFVEEGLKARRISHPNVVRVLDRGTDAELGDFVVYEQVDGGSLASLMAAKRGPMEPRAAAELIAKVSRGIHAVHLAGLLHCDLKPSNVLLTREGEPKVADFGAAARLKREEGQTERIGNIAFMAPEQVQTMDRVLAVTADVYSLGGLLQYLLTGALPESRASRRSDAGAQGRGAVDDPDLAAICGRATAQDPADRYGAADALADDLEAWLWYRPLEWTRPSHARRTRLFLRRQPGTAAVATLGLVAALTATGAAVYLAMSGRQRILSERLTAAERAIADRELADQTLIAAIAGFGTLITPDKREALTAEWMVPVTILESLGGPALFDPLAQQGEIWTGRMAVAERLVAQAIASGQGESIETLLWNDAIAFWALRAGATAKAEEVLKSGDRAWDRLLTRDDGWRTVRDLMHACARVQRADADAAAGKSPAPAQLEEQAQRLASLLESISGRPASQSLRMLNLAHQARLFGPGLLNDGARLANVQAAIDAQRLPGGGAEPAGP